MRNKENLHRDTVQSENWHCGIELELRAPMRAEHDDDDCETRARSREYTRRVAMGRIPTLESLGLSRTQAETIGRFFSIDNYVNDSLASFTHTCENPSTCDHVTYDGQRTREWVRNELMAITRNNSFKVVTDGSIRLPSSRHTDAEVCWNYFASKDCLNDNIKICQWLESKGLTFNESCGLHVNLNNYLDVRPSACIPTSELAFLFNFVGKSRASNQYCNRFAIGTNGNKYSMLYWQGDRIEFRFFSPTLSGEKMNHYVALANVVYRRLAGQNAKLSKKATAFFLDKMMTTNGHSRDLAEFSIYRLNNIPSMTALNTKYQVRAA